MDDKLLDFYSDHMPSNVIQKLNQCLENADTMRQDIFYRERTINLLPLLAMTTYPSGVIPDKSQILKYIMCPEILSTRDVTPQFIQHSSLFVNFIYTKPELFAKVVVDRYGQQDFHFVIYSVVPAFFGFFVTLEHVEASLVFYQEVINIAPANIASVIVQPLFCSMSTFVYIEAVMTDFGAKFGVDPKIDDTRRRKDLIKQFSIELLQLIRQKIHLIPRQILAIFQFTVQSKWTLRELISLFFNHFFSHLSLAWVASSPYSHRVPVFQQVLTEATQNVKLVRDIFKSFLEVESKYEIPQGYKSFNLEYTQLFISIADIIVAAICFAASNKLPSSLTDVNYEIFPLEKRFCPYTIKIYRKNLRQPAKPNFIDRPLIFTNFTKIDVESNIIYDRIYRKLSSEKLLSDRTTYEFLLHEYENPYSQMLTDVTKSDQFKHYTFALSMNEMIEQSRNFEALLTFSVAFHDFEQWNNADLKRQVSLMTPMALNAAKAAMQYDQSNLSLAFKRASKNFVTVELKRQQFYTIISGEIQTAIEARASKFKDLEKKWTDHLQNCLKNIETGDIDRMPNTRKYNFWVCVEELRSLPCIIPPRQFGLLVSTIKKLKMVAGNDPRIPQKVLILSNCVKLPAIFLVSDKFIMKNPIYETLKDDSIISAWQQLGKYLIDFLSGTEAFEVMTSLESDMNQIPEFTQHVSDSDSGSSSSWWFTTKFNDYRLSSSDNI
ncbi:hypothetical protein TVAG_007250 [Trichomonas vaginalis G3]|uniref:Uncharacterized protein n=1 Tax=Trichomonas vaginalis (strain ATCC PRA-98 / G3) TaxID=412133 RepID=A2F4I6_TRIV3|nr:hypothetical protein TVAGG3_0422130 [Trichomonas vaginalis G3]EAY00195.1 hypothetical protein TVAG_007250 [Trichomonas vaginalis G3]KAI5536147.1 hypothetical protein TVAGG3_0422130 [Trichomonas vaginalis G3]|eukprot:XP_001313124.1 hypothetical protein [Trichomonas vaginalis G3]